MRLTTGVHPLIVHNETGLKLCSDIFRTGGEQFGWHLKPPDNKRDPAWGDVPEEKGILKVVM